MLRATMEKRRKQNERTTEKLAELNQSLSPLDSEANVVSANLGVEKKRLDELDLKMKNFGELLETLDSNTTQLFDLQTRTAQELGEIDQNLIRDGASAERTRPEHRRRRPGPGEGSEEVALTAVKKELTDEISGDRIGHARLRKLCEEGGVSGLHRRAEPDDHLSRRSTPGRAPPSWTGG